LRQSYRFFDLDKGQPLVYKLSHKNFIDLMQHLLHYDVVELNAFFF